MLHLDGGPGGVTSDHITKALWNRILCSSGGDGVTGLFLRRNGLRSLELAPHALQEGSNGGGHGLLSVDSFEDAEGAGIHSPSDDAGQSVAVASPSPFRSPVNEQPKPPPMLQEWRVFPLLCLRHSLQVLDVSHNKLTFLSPEIGALHVLRRLDVSHNRLSVLPSSVGSLPRLVHVCAASNRLCSVPSSMCGPTSSIRVIDVRGNAGMVAPKPASPQTMIYSGDMPVRRLRRPRDPLPTKAAAAAAAAPSMRLPSGDDRVVPSRQLPSVEDALAMLEGACHEEEDVPWRLSNKDSEFDVPSLASRTRVNPLMSPDRRGQ